MDRFKKYVEANIKNADLATLVEWKKELDDEKILEKINNQIKVLVERSTYDFKWLNNASYEDFIKLTKGLNNSDEFLTKTYGEKFKEEYNRQKTLREVDANPLRLSYYKPDKRRYANQPIKIIQKPDIPYRNRLRIRSSASAYETSEYDINKLFFLSDNPYYGKYEIGLKSDGQNLLDKLKSAFVEKKRHILFRLEMEYNDFLKGKSGQYVNIYTFDKIGLKPTFNDNLLKKVLHPVDNQGYQKWKKWIKSAQETYASYPVWDPKNLGYQTRNRISGPYTKDDKDLFDLLEENIRKIIDEDKKEKSNKLDDMLEENKRLVNEIDNITREIKKQRQEKEKIKQMEEKNKRELEKMKETKSKEEVEVQEELQNAEQQFNSNINVVKKFLNSFNNDETIKNLSTEEQVKLKKRLELQLRFIKKQQKSMQNRKKYDIPMVIPMSKMKAYIDIKKEIKKLTKYIQLVENQINAEKTKVDKDNEELIKKQQLISNGKSINKEREEEIKKLENDLNQESKKIYGMHKVKLSKSLDNLSEQEKIAELAKMNEKIDNYSKKLEGEDKTKWNNIIKKRNAIISKMDVLKEKEKEERDKIVAQETKDFKTIIKPLEGKLKDTSTERKQKSQELKKFENEMKEKRKEFEDLIELYSSSEEDLETFKKRNEKQLAEITNLFGDEVEIILLEIDFQKQNSAQVNDQNILSEEKTEEEIIETNEASQNEADNSEFISEDDGGSEDDYDSVEENTIQKAPVKANTIQEAVPVNDKDDGIPVASVQPVDLPVVEAEELDEEVGRIVEENGVWWVITGFRETNTTWEEIVGEKIEQDVLKEYAADIVKQNDLNIIEQMVKSKNINIDLIKTFSRQTLKKKASKKKLETFGVNGNSNSDDIKKALLLEALLSAASNITNNQAVVLKPESEFSDYDEFTDEEYGEWKDNSDTGSYMSD